MSPLAARKLVLLDAGGTLITLDYDRVRSCLPGADGLPGDDALARAEAQARRWADTAIRARLSQRELWDGYFSRTLARAGVPPEAIPAALEALWRANRRQGLWRRPVEEAAAVLAALHAAGKRLAVVSNAEGQVEADLADCGLTRWLETVVDSQLVGVAKPDPRIFEIALERVGANAGEALYVGDVPAYDVEGARAAGIPPVLIDPFDVHAEVPVPRISRLAELPRLLGVDFGWTEGSTSDPG